MNGRGRKRCSNSCGCVHGMSARARSRVILRKILVQFSELVVVIFECQILVVSRQCEPWYCPRFKKIRPISATACALFSSLALWTKPTLTPVELKETPDPNSNWVALTIQPEGQLSIAPSLTLFCASWPVHGFCCFWCSAAAASEASAASFVSASGSSVSLTGHRFFDQWYLSGVSRGNAPGSNECGSFSHCARFVCFSRAID